MVGDERRLLLGVVSAARARAPSLVARLAAVASVDFRPRAPPPAAARERSVRARHSCPSPPSPDVCAPARPSPSLRRRVLLDSAAEEASPSDSAAARRRRQMPRRTTMWIDDSTTSSARCRQWSPFRLEPADFDRSRWGVMIGNWPESSPEAARTADPIASALVPSRQQNRRCTSSSSGWCRARRRQLTALRSGYVKRSLCRGATDDCSHDMEGVEGVAGSAGVRVPAAARRRRRRERRRRHGESLAQRRPAPPSGGFVIDPEISTRARAADGRFER